jgi:hypothetical protein
MKCETCERIRARVREIFARRALRRRERMQRELEQLLDTVPNKPPFRNVPPELRDEAPSVKPTEPWPRK